ncbi:hypothetical protein [Rhodococcus phenolicus]|uniref:hypothetical protein n=1 Tax=Rhodococcus phenolicus TaxID=263849 RepID=UPI001FDEC92C|nr:hypothetical protein [Rhodococcus phenolicus]
MAAEFGREPQIARVRVLAHLRQARVHLSAPSVSRSRYASMSQTTRPSASV